MEPRMEQPLPHHSVRIVLLNQKNELLLMKAKDPSTTQPDGTYNGAFWFLIGGEIEKGEDLKTAAFRELFEETGLSSEQVRLGPQIWYGTFDLILSGQLRRMKQQFILARTLESKISLAGLTESERKVVKKVEWYSLEQIRNFDEIIYPVGIEEYLNPILAGNIPDHPIEIILDRKPARKASIGS